MTLELWLLCQWITRVFFQLHNQVRSLLLTLATFGAGFLMHPNRAVLLGSSTDRHGRRSDLSLTLSLMAIGRATFALTPSCNTIGLLAPLIVVTVTVSSKVPEEKPSERSYSLRLLLRNSAVSRQSLPE